MGCKRYFHAKSRLEAINNRQQEDAADRLWLSPPVAAYLDSWWSVLITLSPCHRNELSTPTLQPVAGVAD
jgi:hypothetical protein